MSYWLLIIALPSIVQGYLIGLLVLIFGIGKKPHFDGPILCVYWRDWVEKRWHYTTTIGSFMGRASWFNEWTRYHELVHVRQYTDLHLLSLALGACLIPWIGWQGMLILWATSGAPWLLPNFITGWIRFGNPYRGSEHERSAYAQTYQARATKQKVN